MKKIILPIFIVTALLLVSSYTTHAQTQNPAISPSNLTLIPTPTTVISDYAKDVQNGEKGTVNDVQAQNNQKDVADNENIDAQEEAEAVEPVEKVEPAEAVEPQEAVENESEGDKSGGDTSSEGSKQESDSSSESNKQTDTQTSTDNTSTSTDNQQSGNEN